MRGLLVLVALAAFGFLPGAVPAEPVAEYGVPVRFARDREVAFKDFSIRFVGERRVQSEVYPRGFLFYDFEVRGRRETKTVSWSSGAGEIGATSFRLDGRTYELELGATIARKGFMKTDEFVLWPAAAYQAVLRSKRGN